MPVDPLRPAAPDPAHWSGRRALITGGLGFIGSTLAHRLAEYGADVVLVDSLVPEYGGNPANVADLERRSGGRVRVNISDIRDPHSMRHLVQDREVIFNLAGQTSHMDSMRDPFTDLEINCTAQLRLLEVCRQVAPQVKIVYASTRQIYGKPDYLPVDERHLLRPTDVNGVNKMAGEWYHVLYNNVYGLKACALRLTNTYGPRMRVKDARQTFLGVWIKLLVEGKPFEVWGGEQKRDFTYGEDCAEALLLAAESPETDGKIYNIGGDSVVTLAELADALIRANGGGSYEIKEFPADRKRIDIGDYYADDTMFRQAVGWAPRTPLEQGLAETLAYYRETLPKYL
ncbi:MAG TPA: NAD-dependent epimerase/dehydratase family protein [Azospirillaceae bacterium]|nr:NAD-dependent epimerase/dehydratase family protein [Azospirillaceae bacterium]